jgi:enoyl-[acyl-carrier-protein] reductase (NADH)
VLDGHRLLVTGVGTPDSLAYATARRALLSPLPRGITGSVVHADGGHASIAAPLRRDAGA